MPILNYRLLTLTHLFHPFMVLKTRGALPVTLPISPLPELCVTPPFLAQNLFSLFFKAV